MSGLGSDRGEKKNETAERDVKAKKKSAMAAARVRKSGTSDRAPCGPETDIDFPGNWKR